MRSRRCGGDGLTAKHAKTAKEPRQPPAVAGGPSPTLTADLTASAEHCTAPFASFASLAVDRSSWLAAVRLASRSSPVQPHGLGRLPFRPHGESGLGRSELNHVAVGE